MGGPDPAEQVLLLLITCLVSRCYETHQHRLRKHCPCVSLIEIAFQEFAPTFCIAWPIEVFAECLSVASPVAHFRRPVARFGRFGHLYRFGMQLLVSATFRCTVDGSAVH